jgi:hypothetical protein
MQNGTPQDPQELEAPMQHAHVSASEPRLDSLLSSSVVRPEAVARARQLLASSSWCHAEEVASQLVDCMVDRRLP